MRTAGHSPGEAPPDGRRKWTFAGVDVPEADTPTTDWASLIRSGYSVVYGVLIDGIPYMFGERKLYTVNGIEAASPSSDHTRSSALVITTSPM